MNTRRYILIAALIVIGMYDYLHMRARKQATAPPVNVQISAPHSPEAQAAWAAYDHAASLRDATTDQFHPAFEAFDAAKAEVPATQTTDAQSFEACRIWLLEYRSDGSMHTLAISHVGSCVQLHRDVAK